MKKTYNDAVNHLTTQGKFYINLGLDRISEILKFNSFDLDDVKMIIEQLSEVKITDEAIEFIHKKANRFRQIVKLISVQSVLHPADKTIEVDTHFAIFSLKSAIKSNAYKIINKII